MGERDEKHNQEKYDHAINQSKALCDVVLSPEPYPASHLQQPAKTYPEINNNSLCENY